jgi:hypothetical protein
MIIKMHTSGEDKYDIIWALTNEASVFRNGIKARLRTVFNEMVKDRDFL